MDNTANLSRNSYLVNNPYRDLADDDNDNENFYGNGVIDIFLDTAPNAAAKLIIDVEK